MSNNVPFVDQCISADANLVILKECPTQQIVSGKPGPFFFTITVGNLGPSDSLDVTVMDAVPTQFFKDVSVFSVDAPFTCEGVALVGNANVVRCFASRVANGYSGKIVVSFAPVAGFVTTQTAPNSANISSARTNDPTGPNFSSCNTIIVPPPDVSIAKTGPFAILIDDVNVLFTYTITIRNNGPGVAEAVKFNDTAPAEVVPDYNTRVIVGAPNNCVVNGKNIMCELGNLAEFATVNITFQFRVPQTSASSTTNCATVSLPLEIANGAGNNQACNTTLLSQGANLAVQKFTPDVCAGASGFYRLTVTNLGPATARTSSLQDVLNANVYTSVSVINVTSNFGTVRPNSICTVNGANVLNCDLGNVAVGEVIEIVFSYFVPALQRAQSVFNNVTVTSATVDLLSSNNWFVPNPLPRVLECVTITPAKTGSPVVVAGSRDTYSYTISFTNTGLSAASSGTVTLSDTLPSIGFVLANPIPADCTPGNVGGFASLFCTFPDVILPGASRSRTIFFTVLESTLAGNVTNCVRAGGDVPAPIGIQACIPTEIRTAADIAVNKTRTGPCIVSGFGSGLYTLTVSNNGPSTGYNVRMSDNIPSQFRYVGETVTTNTIGGTPCSFPTAGTLGGSISCNFGTFRTTDRYVVVYELSVPASQVAAAQVIVTII